MLLIILVQDIGILEGSWDVVMRGLCKKKERGRRREIGIEEEGREKKKEREEGRDREREEGRKVDGMMNSGECLHSLVTLNRGVFRLQIPSGIRSSPKKTH